VFYLTLARAGAVYRGKVLGRRTMKRLTMCAIVFGLTVLGPAPFSVCSLLSSVAGDCAASGAQVNCDKMDMSTAPAQTIGARSVSCCAMSQAPLPESRKEASKISPQEEPVAVPAMMVGVINFEDARGLDVPQDVSPGPQQSLLCTFLI
jgi:hypothetical protein